MNPQTDQESQNSDINLLVVGAGGAGLAAAVSAAERGLANIVVLEKRNTIGGNSAIASGIFGAESPTQKRQAIIAPKDDMYRRMMDWTHLSANPRIIRAFIDKSGDTVGWLEDKGLWFRCVPHSPIDAPMTWHVPEGNGAEIIRVLTDECRRLGARIITGTRVKKILTSPAGAVTGVVAEKDEKETTFSAKAVVISTGGFAGNKELLRKYCPKFQESMMLGGVPHQGEGILMALDIGAATEGLGMLMAAAPFGVGARRVINLGSGADVVPLQLVFISGEPSVIWVNQKGRRFIDETASFNYYECVNAVIQQPDGVCYAIFDTGMLRKIIETGLSNVPEGHGYGERQRRRLPEGLEKELQSLADKGTIVISESWEEIARWIGVDPQVLKETIDEYNLCCDRGHDPVFAKGRAYLTNIDQPPYYAIKCISSYLNTMGGIKINERMEVLDKGGDAVPGLYAAGVDTGGWTSDTYCAALPGTAFGFAINSGRIAGESVFDFINSD